MNGTSPLAEAGSKAGTLIEALPYIRSYRGQTVVVKIGGEALDDPAHSRLVAEDLALLSLVGIRLVIVHGGGPQVTTAMAAAGREARFVSGLRVTSEEDITIVQQVLIGTINAGLVGRLVAVGLSAVGLSGIDGRLIEATVKKGPAGEDLGRVGEPVSVRPDLVRSLLAEDHTPVVASVALDREGGVLNVNADSAAGAIAGSLGAAKLVYLTNVEGLYRDLGDAGSLLSELKVGELATMCAGLSEGMRPKASSAVDALRQGVGKVHILDGRVPHALLLEIFTDHGIGTQVLP